MGKTKFESLDNALDVKFEDEMKEVELNKKLYEKFTSMAEEENIKDKSETAISDIESEVRDIEIKKDEIEHQITSAKIRDVEFLTTEIKSLIISSKAVLNTLEGDIKIGAAPRMYEVYATLLNAITTQYKELRQLNESVAKLIIENKKQNLETVKEDHKMMLSGNELLNMISDAQDNSELNDIDAEFIIEDDDIK